ncbi:unnamed protein product [Arctogadus glacialis]
MLIPWQNACVYPCVCVAVGSHINMQPSRQPLNPCSNWTAAASHCFASRERWIKRVVRYKRREEKQFGRVLSRKEKIIWQRMERKQQGRLEEEGKREEKR